MGKWISQIMLITMRDFVIKHKNVFELAIIAYAKILPEPTHENVLEQNSHVLLDMREKWRGYYTNNGKRPLFEAAWKIAICENEHDPHYRDIVFGWGVEEVVEAVLDGLWQPRRSRHPGSSGWKEPKNSEGNYGNYNGRSFKALIKKTPN